MNAIAWRTALSDVDQRQIKNVFDAAGAADGTAPVGDQVLRELSQDRTRHLVAEVDDVVVGYLNLVPATDDAPPMAEVAVHPDSRRHGIGSELIREALAEGGAGTRVWAHGNLEPARATAAALDLVAARELLQMRRSLRALPAVKASDGVLLRTYEGPSDDAELLRVNNAAFSWHPEQGGWTEADVAERRGESWFDPEGLFLAFDEGTGRLLGFHWTKVHGPTLGGQERSDSGDRLGGQERSDSGDRLGGQERSDSGSRLGEVYVVGVDPDAQGRGLGATLTLVGLHHLADRLGASAGRSEATRGIDSAGRSEATREIDSAEVTLYVEADNSAAVKTYERLGFAVFSSDVAYTLR